ncbi:NAD(P)/FAD-dependent oxidoreductase [Isoptericola variabilis]|uniref:NADH dehydrogenase n=1 Tax=Isoptericola variabilis (strain 225) TaxID=743718 RepID=F6FS83_ISOV2|nr:NAD(P)/FAD-dependent oxidoreductase [Isoptericola variabilis]AEG43024.1 NADH dehydrogenase [Isoptericola variabilis 225]TWH30133.1 NADH dehydrogenase [Isoptericola variabilis J7]
MSQQGRLPHVVVVGGGFGGLAVVKALKDAPVRVTLVERHVYNTFQPLLYQVATGGLNPGDVTYWLRGLRLKQKNVRVLHEQLVGIDHDARRIRLLNDEWVDFDFLVIANGVTVSYFGTPGAHEHAFGMYSRSQALKIRDQLFIRLEKSAFTHSMEDGLRVVVVGGGATGVEVAGALAELRTAGLAPAYPEIHGSAFEVKIVQRGTELLKGFHPDLRRYAEEELKRRGVTLHLGAGVAEVLPDAVVLTGGTRIHADLTIWSAGVAPHPEVDGWDLPRGPRGRIAVGPDLQVEGRPGVFAVGDIAATPDELPQLAQPAIQGGRTAARNILALIEGRPTEPLRYRDKGTMAVIGRRAAVAEINVPGLRAPLRLTAGLAWIVWLFVHIMSLVGPRNRVTTLAGLVTRYGFPFHRRPIPIVGEVPTVRPPKEPSART